MKCENCNSNHTGEYGSGRFCSIKCARGFSTKANRLEINKKVSKTLGGKNFVPREDFCICCGKKLKRTSKKFCDIHCLHEYKYLIFINKWKLGFEDGRKGRLGTSNYIKKYLFSKYNSKCQLCGWSAVNKTSKKIPLEMHHINGDFLDNSEDNIHLLCPNCHSLTSTYKNLNKDNKRVYTQKR